MIQDLPEISDIFESDHKQDISKSKGQSKELKEQDLTDDIIVSVSRGDDKWIQANFLDVAPSNIGIHVLMPIEMDIRIDNMSNFKLKFEERKNDLKIVLKELAVLIRWQERDQISGRVKLGLHFHGDTKNEPEILKILERLKSKKL